MTAKTRTLKRKRAVKRKTVRNQLSPEEQLILLDQKFGIDRGAKLERTRLHNTINNRNEKTETGEN